MEAQEQTKSRAEQIAAAYPKFTAKPGKGVYVCSNCGLVNNSKNPFMRSSFIRDQFVAHLGSLMLLTTADDPGRPAATPDNLRGWKVDEEEANFCYFDDYGRDLGPRRVWTDKHHEEEETRYRKTTYKPYKVKVWRGGYQDLPPIPRVFYQEGMKHGEYTTNKKWFKLQMEPEQDLVLKMSIFPGQTLAERAKDLIETIRDIPEDRVEQVICHLAGTHKWEGTSEV